MRFLVIIGLLTLSLNGFGQLTDPLIGPEYATSKKENFSGFLGENAIGLFTADYIFYSRKKQELIIRHFHKGDLQLVDTKNIYTIIEDGYTNEPEEIFYQNGKFYLFSKMMSDRDKSRLMAVEVFNESCERLHYAVIDTLKDDEIQYIEEAEDKNGFVIAKHLRFTQLVEQEIDLKFIDQTGNINWFKTVKSPMALQNLRIEQIRFNSDSPVYVLCNYAFDISTNETDNDRLVNNKYALWAYDRDEEFLKEFELRLKSKWVNGIEMKLNAKNQLIIGGFFNETRNPSINGVFSLIIDDELKVQNSAWHKFSEQTLSKFIQKKENSRKKWELNDYQMKDLVLMDDGTFYTVGEQYYKYIERSYDPRTNITTTTEHYNYNSIITSYFDKTGKHRWTERVPKAQNSTNDYGYFSSFTTMNGGDELYFFFNDARKNNAEKPQGYFGYTNLFNNRRFQISYVRIDKNGIVNRDGLLDDKYSYMLRAKLSGQITTNSIYLITESSRNSKIVRVSLKD